MTAVVILVKIVDRCPTIAANRDMCMWARYLVRSSRRDEGLLYTNESDLFRMTKW